MALKVIEKDSFWIKTKLQQPLDFAQTQNHQVNFKLKKLSNDDWKAIVENKTVAEVLAETLLDFEGLGCVKGEFTDEDKAQLLEYNWAVDEIWKAQMAIQNGKTYGMKLGN